jgi:hypothetical protein
MKFFSAMATAFPVKLSVTLNPVYHADPPEIRMGINSVGEQFQLTEKRTFVFEFQAEDSACLLIEFVNKIDQDTVPALNLDKAVIIESVSFFGITDSRFVWCGEYTPVYPEPWFSEQHPQPPKVIPSATYLGWNGQWKLGFTVPVFTWIHQIQSLGWLY